jgi:hypothetical protein
MYRMLLALFLCTAPLHAQDLVKLIDGTQMNVKIVKETPESIAFERGKSDVFYVIKDEIDEIRHENGTVEKFAHHERSLDEIKAYVVKLVNENALAEKSGRQFTSRFEGDFLRMVVLGSKSGEELNDGLLFDFSHVYQFDRISFRDNNRAYLNIWTDRVRWPNRSGKDRMDKIKFITRVNDHEKASLLMFAFIELNKALKKEQIKNR